MTSIGRYRILGEIGRGEATVVYRAMDPLNRVVAIKTFPAQFPHGSEAARAWAEQFTREVEAAARLDHPNIVRVYDAGVQGTLHFVAMEYVDGQPLSEAMRLHRLDLAQKLRIAIQLTDAVAAAHAQQVLHQNVRPSNILLTADANVKLTDFGLGELGAASSEVTPVPGPLRIHYRAPEQVYGKKADSRTDVFSTGIVLYELLLEKRPFDGPSWVQVTHKILNVDPPELKTPSGEHPDGLLRLLLRALAKNPLDRYQSMRDLHGELAAMESALKDHAPSSTDAGATSPGSSAPTKLRAGPHLVVEDAGRRRILPLLGAKLTLGRRNDNDLPLRDEHISRYHAEILLEDERHVLVDRGSKHGTFVNGRRVERATLAEGDRIELGRNHRFQITYRISPQDSETPTSGVSQSAARERTLELLLDVAHALNSSLSLDDVLNLIMESALTFTGAERGFIMLRDDKGNYATRLRRYVNATGMSLADETISRTAVDRCIATEKPVLIHNVDEFAEFAQRESVLDMNLKAILCVPLLCKGTVLGLLYLDSRQLKAPFTPDQIELLLAFGSHAAIALENARLYEMAIMDALTGVYLRHHFLVRLAEELNRSGRHGSPLSLLFIDVDHFKKVNDTYGHPIGDNALRGIASTLKAMARNTDIVGRYGGEEFVLLAPETSLEAATVLAERVRVAVREKVFEVGDRPPISITVSVGVACHTHPDVTTPDDLVREADEALLDAKRMGRDRVSVAPPRAKA